MEDRMKLMLLLVSVAVAVGLWMRMNMWPLIAFYWSVLALKNLKDWLGRNE